MTAPHRPRNLDDAIRLIEPNQLAQVYAAQLHPFARAKFAELWQFAQISEDYYIASKANLDPAFRLDARYTHIPNILHNLGGESRRRSSSRRRCEVRTPSEIAASRLSYIFSVSRLRNVSTCKRDRGAPSDGPCAFGASPPIFMQNIRDVGIGGYFDSLLG